MSIILSGKRDFIDVNKLRILRWGDDPGLSEGSLNPMIIFLRETKTQIQKRRPCEEGDRQ